MHICDYCGEGFKSRRARILHTADKHTRTRKFPCPVCGRTFRSRTLVQPHLREAHGLDVHVDVEKIKSVEQPPPKLADVEKRAAAHHHTPPPHPPPHPPHPSPPQ